MHAINVIKRIALRAFAASILIGTAWAETVQDERAARDECSEYSQAGSLPFKRSQQAL
jgi:hypothetical protein